MPYTEVSLGQLRRELQDRYEDLPFWTEAEADFAINESLRWWNLFTGHWRRRVAFTTIVNIPWHAVPGSLVYNTRVSFNDFPLSYSSLFDLDYGRNGWQGETTLMGSPIPSRPKLWAPAGLDLFAIWPADGAGCNLLIVDGIAATPVLTNVGNKVDLSQAEHHAILGEALHIAAFKEGGPRLRATTSFHQEFLRAAADLNDRLTTSSFYRQAMGRDRDHDMNPVGVKRELSGEAPNV